MYSKDKKYEDQASIFDFINQPEEELSQFEIGDAAKITLVNSDEMSIEYFKNYYPQAINKEGTIVAKKMSSRGMLYWINVRGEEYTVYEHELIPIY